MKMMRDAAFLQQVLTMGQANWENPIQSMVFGRMSPAFERRRSGLDLSDQGFPSRIVVLKPKLFNIPSFLVNIHHNTRKGVIGFRFSTAPTILSAFHLALNGAHHLGSQIIR